MTNVKRLLDEATPLPWDYRTAADAALYGEEDEFLWTPANIDLAVNAVNRLPDYEAAVEALERVFNDVGFSESGDPYWNFTRPEPGGWKQARAALRRLRDEVLA